MKIPYDCKAIVDTEDTEDESTLRDYTLDLAEVKAYGSVENDTFGDATEIVVGTALVTIYISYKEFRKVMKQNFRPCGIINFN